MIVLVRGTCTSHTGIVAVSMLMLLAVTASAAETQPTTTVEAPLLFRREMLTVSPKSEKGLAVIKGLFPFKRAEFDELLAALQSRESGSVPETWIEAIELEAQQRGNLLVGQARLHIRQRPRASANDQPSLLSLAPWQASLFRPAWQDSGQAAVVGMNKDGILTAVVPRSGVLTFDWQLAGQRDPWQAVLFDLSLVEASRGVLSLTLPGSSRLETSTGTVRVEPAGESTARWTVEFGGTRELRLRSSPDAGQTTGPVVLVREESTCTVGEGDTEIQCQLRLDVYREPVAQLGVDLLGGWQPTAVRLGDVNVPFDFKSQDAKAWLTFDPPLSGLNRRLTIIGRTQVVQGVRMEAPRVRIRNSAWLDGKLTIQTTNVRLSRWKLEGLQRAPGVMGAQSSHTWALVSQDSAASFHVERLPPQLRANSGSTVRIDVEAATAAIITDFSAESAGVFELTAGLSPGWIIDSVEMEPPQVLDDWELDSSAAEQQLRIGLLRSVGPGQKVRVLVEAHRPPPSVAETLTGNELRPVRWKASEARGHMALAIDSLWQLDSRGAERLQQIDPDSLRPEEADRLELSDDVVVFADDESFDVSRLELAQESPKFAAAWHLKVRRDTTGFRQEARLRVEPAQAPVERVHVLVQPPLGKQLEWQLLGDDGSGIQAQLVRAATGPAEEDEWELTLGRARRNSFTLLATYFGKPVQSANASFFRCVEAASQTGAIEVLRSPKTWLVADRSTGLRRQWNSANDETLLRWTYDPAQPAELVLRSASLDESGQLLMVHRAHLQTRVAENYVFHEANYSLTNLHAQSFVVHLPAGSEVDQVLLQGQPADVRSSAGGQMLHIAVPESTANLELRVAYRMPASSQGASVFVSAAWPEANLPVAVRSWEVLYPQEYRRLSLDHTAGSWQSLWRRLHGSLPGFEPAEPTEPTDASAAPGCSRVTFGASTPLPHSVRLIHEDALGGMGWALLAMAWVVVVLHPRGVARRLAWLIAALGAVALSLPQVLDPLPQMVLLGLGAGMLSRQALRHPLGSAASPLRRELQPSLSVATLGMVLALLGGLGATSMLKAQEPAARPVIHRVVFPVDEAGKPTDDYIWASEAFFRELFLRATRPATTEPTSLVVSGTYRARPRADALSWESIEGTLSAEVLQPGAVRIPWPREGFIIPPERVRLDGRATPITWDEDGTAFSIAVETAGPHVFQFLAQPTSRVDQSLKLSLPAAAANRLLIDTLDDAARVRVLPGPPAMDAPDEVGVIAVELGQESQLTLHTDPTIGANAKINAEQLIWTNLWRGATVIEGRWRFKATVGDLSEAAVDVGGGLELISAAALTPASVQWLPAEGKSRIIWSPRTPTDELVVEAVLLQRHPDPLRVLPRIEPVDATVIKRWLAIDPQGAVDFAPLAIPADDRIEVAEFAALWNAEEWPRVARRLIQAGPVPLMAEPVEASLVYAGTTRCEVDARETHWEFRAELKALNSPRHFLELAATPDMKVDAVEVSRAGLSRSVPWLILADGNIALLPGDPLVHDDVIMVKGTLASAAEQVFTPPSILGTEATTHAVELMRHRNVQVFPISHPGLTRTTTALESSGLLLPVAQFEIDRTTPPAERRLSWRAEPNHPRTVGILVTTLRQEDTHWVARLDAFLAVRDGVVDALRLEAPLNWSSPQVVAGDAALRTQELPGGVRQMELTPRDASSTRFHLTLEGTLAAGQKIEVPVFKLLDAENVQQYLRLPRDDGHEWSTAGVQASALPTAASLENNPNLDIYRAAVPHFQVALRNEPQAKSSPRVAWGDVLVASRTDQSYVALATLALDPSNRSALDFTLPPGALVVQAQVEGEADVVELQGQRRFRLPLRSSSLPQLVRLVYTGTHEPGISLMPQFSDWRLDRELSVRTPGDPEPTPDLSDLTRLLAATPERWPAGTSVTGWANRWLARLIDASTKSDQVDAATEAFIARLRVLSDAEAPPGRDSLQEFALQLTSAEAPPPPPAPVYAVWLTSVVAWSGLVAIGYRANRWQKLHELARRWPGAVAVLTGLAVAVLLAPWIGGVFMILAASSALCWPWRPRG